MTTPELDNGGRWHHIASDAEIKRAMNAKGSDVIEWPTLGKTFVVNFPLLTVVRTNAMGGDTFEIEGGWVFPNDLAMRFDVQEIRTVATNVKAV